MESRTDPKDTFFHEQTRPFLKFLSERTGIGFNEWLLIWPIFCTCCLEWILQRGSVHLGFCTLHPTPYRANWKQIILSLFPRLGPSLWSRRNASGIKQILIACGLEGLMQSGALLAVARSDIPYVRWGVEVELHRSYWRAMKLQETLILKQKGAADYAKYIAYQIESKFRDKAFRIYMGFIKEVSYPCGSVPGNRPSSTQIIEPCIPPGRVSWVAPYDLPACIWYPLIPREVPPGSSNFVEATHASLSQLLRLQPEVEVVRSDPGAGVGEPPESWED